MRKKLSRQEIIRGLNAMLFDIQDTYETIMIGVTRLKDEQITEREFIKSIDRLIESKPFMEKSIIKLIEMLGDDR